MKKLIFFAIFGFIFGVVKADHHFTFASGVISLDVLEKRLEGIVISFNLTALRPELRSFFATLGGATDGSVTNEDVIAGIKSLDNGSGKIDFQKFSETLVNWESSGTSGFPQLGMSHFTWGDKFSEDEVDDPFDQMVIDDKGFIDTAALITMLTGSEEEEE